MAKPLLVQKDELEAALLDWDARHGAELTSVTDTIQRLHDDNSATGLRMNGMIARASSLVDSEARLATDRLLGISQADADKVIWGSVLTGHAPWDALFRKVVFILALKMCETNDLFLGLRRIMQENDARLMELGPLRSRLDSERTKISTDLDRVVVAIRRKSKTIGSDIDFVATARANELLRASHPELLRRIQALSPVDADASVKGG